VRVAARARAFGARVAFFGLYAAAIVVMLMIAIIPVLVYQVRHFRMQEESR